VDREPYVEQNPGLSHVILDDYNSHKTPDVLRALRSLNCIVSILPGGSISQIHEKYLKLNGYSNKKTTLIKRKTIVFCIQMNGCWSLHFE
jgi:hypothetical protein